MGIAEDVELRKEAATPKPRKCKLALLVESLSPDDELAFKYAMERSLEEAAQQRPLNERIFTGQWLTDVLNKNGYRVSSTVVRDHLAGKCTCDRSE